MTRKRFYGGLAVAFLFLWTALFFALRNPSLAHGPPIAGVEVDPTRLEKNVRALADIQPARNYENLESLNSARAHIASELRSYGYEIELQPIHDPKYQNVIARYGRGDKTVVIGAHYDVADHANPGADDNASGVAGLLELARLLQTLKPQLAFTVELVFYTLEEPPYFGGDEMGSAFHARAMKARGAELLFMLSLEMIGYFNDELFSQKYLMPGLYALYPTRGDFIALVGPFRDRSLQRRIKSAMKINSDVPVYSIAAPEFIQGTDFSDHRNYWQQGWPAFMITNTAFLRNSEYHKSGDTADRLDYLRMAEVVRGVYGVLMEVSR